MALRCPPLLLQIQSLAARCIQKNLAVYRAVQSWPWWQLMCGIRPLLTISLAEGQLQVKEVRELPGEKAAKAQILFFLRYSRKQFSKKDVLATSPAGTPRYLG